MDRDIDTRQIKMQMTEYQGVHDYTEESMVILSGHCPEKRICKACSMAFIGCSMAFVTTWPTGENMPVINSIILTVMQLFIFKVWFVGV